MKIPKQCPMCGSPAWSCINTYRSGFSFRKSFWTSLLFGRSTGIWFGTIGKKRKVYACQSCRFMIEYEK